MMSSPTTIAVPRLALVLLVGPSGCGKSTFARRHFAPTEVVSSDACRALVADDEGDQSATSAAFEVLHAIVDKRLERARFTVVDATNLRATARRPLLALAHRHHTPVVAIAFALPLGLCLARNAARPDRAIPGDAVTAHHAAMGDALDALSVEDVRAVHVLDTPGQVEAAVVERVPLPCDRQWDHGPFDIVGDVHGCAMELELLLGRLGWARGEDDAWRHPAGRRLVFVGDLVDRGPRSPDVLRWVMASVAAGTALCLPGNHDDKLRRKLRGRNVKVAHGLEKTLAQLADQPPEFVASVAAFIESLPSHLLLDGGTLCVAHAGMKRGLQGRDAPRVSDFALYGETTGEVDEFGLPIRYNWAAEYRGRRAVVYGHTPVPSPEWCNETIDIDTGCVFGGALTVLRWPERELVSEPAREKYAESARPFLS